MSHQSIADERWLPTRFGSNIATDYAYRRNLERLIAEAEHHLAHEGDDNL